MRTMPRAATATIGAAPPVNLPPGTRLRSLTAHGDRRGWLVEAFRAEWEPDVAGAQVNVSSSAPGVLRGSHVHGRHTDYFVLAPGPRLTLGLRSVPPTARGPGRLPAPQPNHRTCSIRGFERVAHS